MNVDSKTRVQFDMKDSKLTRLEELMNEAGIETRKDYFNNALSMFEWAIEELKKGRVIGTIDPQTGAYNQLVMPILSGIRRTVTPPPPVAVESAPEGFPARAATASESPRPPKNPHVVPA
jgi:hypothetical protein